MQHKILLALTSKLLEVCSASKDAAIYSLVPTIAKADDYSKNKLIHCLDNCPLLLTHSLEIFSNNKNGAKSSQIYNDLVDNKENLINIFRENRIVLGEEEELKIAEDKIDAALALVSSLYFKSFIHPIQFFLPHSSACSGQWNLWEKSNYLTLLEKFENKEFIFKIKAEIINNKVWNTKFKPEQFTEIVKRRLHKENAFDSSLDKEAMLKALIIRMGEIAHPSINYEVIDYCIRSFFTHLGVKKYLRIDREIKFLRILEEEMKGMLGE